jgi:hypothetical protein
VIQRNIVLVVTIRPSLHNALSFLQTSPGLVSALCSACPVARAAKRLHQPLMRQRRQSD